MFTPSIPGESPPPPPRGYFGRGDLVEKVVGLAENLTPIALIGVGGIGKTSTALTVLHDDRIKKRFGDDRRFIRCDQFPASLTHFLRQLSKVIGAGAENPEDLAALRPFLSSRELIVVLDNAESILDPRGTNAREIYTVVEELGQFDNICLCITSRISTIPPNCKLLDIPTLSMDAARCTFFQIYDSDEQPDVVNDILEQLDFHPLSITLLATVARHNRWSTNRLSREWARRRTGVLHVQHSKSLAATIELSLSSPMFQELGPDARDLLGVVAFFPQGVDENNIDWLFPTVSDRADIFDNFCMLSLTYRSNGFIRMLAPLRDHLCPKDPGSTQLLCATRDRYFSRLSIRVTPGKPGFEEMRWIITEDVNVEHLLDAFTTIGTGSDDIWNACVHFLHHLRWHKPRLVALKPNIEGLPDDHPSKALCLSELSRVLYFVGKFVESKQLLVYTLGLLRERGNDDQVAQTLVYLSDANRLLSLYKEGTQQAKDALEIFKRLDNISGQAQSLERLARSLYEEIQYDAAEEAASRAIDLSSGEGDQFLVCRCHRLLGDIYYYKQETERSIIHHEEALRIASSFNWDDELFWGHFSLAELFSKWRRFGDAYAHIERSKTHAGGNIYNLGRAMELQGEILQKERRPDEARWGLLRAAEVFEKLGATQDLERCRYLLKCI